MDRSNKNKGKQPATSSKPKKYRPRVDNTPTPRGFGHEEPVYRPEPPRGQSQPMFYASPPPTFYPQQQFHSQPILDPRYYNIQQTAEGEFNPFTFREPQNVDEDSDDLEEVPETQPDQFQEEDEPVETQPKRYTKRAEKMKWTDEEEVALAKAWVHISTCRQVGNEQGRDQFWLRILEHFNKSTGGTTRTHHGLNTKWSNMNTAMNYFNGVYIQATRMWKSGCDQLDVIGTALQDYKTKNKKPFTHVSAWKVVRNEPKWLEQPLIGQTSTGHSDKRRKSSESGHYESAGESALPDLNEDTTPTRPRKGKSRMSEDSTAAAPSAQQSIINFTSKKEAMMDKIGQQTAALLAVKIHREETKAKREDFALFTQPHEQITDPSLLEWILDQKRTIAAKYGWQCNF